MTATRNLRTWLMVSSFLLALASTATGVTLYVNTDGSGGAYTSIQAAIDAAADGDEIEAAPGTYNEAINFDGKAVRLYSSGGPEVTTIDITGQGLTVVTCNSGETADTILEGFTITGGNASRGGGMLNDGDDMLNDRGSSPKVTNCIFTSNRAEYGGGMYNAYGSDPIVTNCIFEDNETPWFGGGMLNKRSSPTVTNCTFLDNSASSDGGGMCNYEGSSPTVTNCAFSGNSGNWGGGMHNYQGSNPTVTDCTFSGNSANRGGGMENRDNSAPVVTNCTFLGNSATYAGGGMSNYEASTPTATNCTFSGNSATGVGGGMYNKDSSPTVINCIFWGNTPDQIVGPADVDYSDVEGGWLGDGNIDENPLFEPETCRPLPGSPCIDAGDNDAVTVEIDLDGNPRIVDGDFDGNPRVDMGAYERVKTLHVPNPYETIQSAIDAATSGFSQIEVAPGAYYEAIDFDGKAVRLYSSGGPAVTTIDGTGYYHVVQCVNGEGSDTILEGFTITGGNASGESPDDRGGGMYLYSSSPTVVNCVFSDNTAADSGGGMYNDDSGPTVIDCTFTANTANKNGGGMNNYLASPELANCTFTSNSADLRGGGMRNDQSSPTVADCTFTDNSAGSRGGGMGNFPDSSPTVANCTFSGNTASLDGGGVWNAVGSNPMVTNCTFTTNSADARGGGMWNDQSNPTLTNCTFIGNLAWKGGGIRNDDSSPTVTNCTFSGNTATAVGGGMWNLRSSPTVTNCILWGNTPDQMFFDAGAPNVTYSDVQGGTGQPWFGEGCIDANPAFADPEGEGRLSWGSPCIDAGYNDAVTVETDLDGKPRIVNYIVDMGAYEKQTTLHVPAEYDTIQAAISAAVSEFEQIEVAPGTYNEAINFNGKAIRLYSSGGPEVTIIDASGLNSTVVSCNSGENANTILDGFTITGGNAFRGGGMLNDSSSPTVTNCIFTSNWGEYGGGMYNACGSHSTVTNCVFGFNSAHCGGGMLNKQSTPTVTNCTFNGNSASPWNGGGMYNQESNPTVTNCILWGNSPGEIIGSATVTYSNVQGGYAGTGNIYADPMFATGWRLSPGSRCMDAGDNTACAASTDLGGNPRFADFPGRDDIGSGVPPIVDMGAYEYVWADVDADGIEDCVDTLPHVYSSSFDDGCTSGSVHRLNQLVVVGDYPDPRGVWVGASGGIEPAGIFICSSSFVGLILLDAGEEVVLTFHSLEVEVVQGTVEITFVVDDGTEAQTSLNEGNCITFEPETCVFTTPESNVDDVVVIVDGGEIILTPGQSKLIATNVADFSILALNNGALIINSGTSVIGDVGYSSGVTSETNQKVTLFDGSALVHSQVQAFSYTAKNFAPTGGINYGEAVNLKLDKANAEAVSASAHYGSLTPTHILGDLADDDSMVVESVGPLNVISLGSLNYKEDSLELVSREGFNDYFIVNVHGSFNFAASLIVLTGTTPGHVLFNFLGDSSCDIVINKEESVFCGTILGPSANIEYHNPATFVGAIIGLNINLHSDFNLIHEPFDYPWQ